MNTTKTFALAATILVGLGSAAMAGEGSPDLAQPYYGSHESDPDGSNYPPTGAFSGPNAGWRGQSSAAPRLPERDLNTGRTTRQRGYEDQTEE